MDASAFIRKLSKLKAAQIKGERAPHKAVLLLSVLQSMEAGEVTENRVYITPLLVARFKDNWHAYVRSERFHPNFALPFYHLKSDLFWHLQTWAGREILLTASHSIKSFQSLKYAVAYAWFDAEVYALLQDATIRRAAMDVLQQTYLGGAAGVVRYSIYDEVAEQILTESATEYRLEVAGADEEELFVRSGVFKRVVPRVYNYTCCVSGLRISSTRDVQMVDACHIVPFAESHDDTISNGLSLSPNVHRAFDRFLITIDEDYRVVVSDSFTEEGSHTIRAFAGKELLLPKEAADGELGGQVLV